MNNAQTNSTADTFNEQWTNGVFVASGKSVLDHDSIITDSELVTIISPPTLYFNDGNGDVLYELPPEGGIIFSDKFLNALKAQLSEVVEE